MKLRICLVDVPRNLPSWVYEADGNVFLDIDSGTVLTKTKSATQLTDINTITGDAVLGASLSRTDKNELILGGIMNASKLDFTNTYFVKVKAFDGAIALKQNLLEIISKGLKYEFELSDSTDHWKYQIEGRTLNELDYPIVRFTEDWLISQWTNDKPTPEEWADAHLYGPGHIGVYFSMWHCGNWRESLAEYDDDDNLFSRGKSGLSDLLPVWHFQPMLEKIFCLGGWTFRCDALTSEWGRAAGSKLSINFDEDILKSTFGFEAHVTEDYVAEQSTDNPDFWSNTIYLQAIDDNNDGYDRGEFEGDAGYYVGFDYANNTPVYEASGLSGNYTLEGTIRVNTIPFNSKAYWELWVIINGNVETRLTGTVVDNNISEKIVSTVLDVVPTDKIQVYVQTVATYGTNGLYKIMKGTKWGMYPNEIRLGEGMILKLSDLLPAENCMDFVKGFADLIRAKIKTDWITKTVTFYPPHDVEEKEGKLVKGFYNDEKRAINLTESVLCSSETTYSPEPVDYRDIQVAFKATTDNFAKSLGFGKDNRPYGRKIAANRFARAGTIKTIENPYFEPTLNKFSDDITDVGDLPVELPANIDNKDNKISKKHTPRVVTIVGYTRQFGSTDGNSITYRKYRWKSTVKEFLPWVTQLSFQGHGENNLSPVNNMVYGIQDYDLWRFWERDFYDRNFGNPVDFDAVISDEFFDSVDFRDYIRIYSEGRELVLKLDQISGFNSGGVSASKLKLLSPYKTIECNIDQSTASTQFYRCDFYMDFGPALSVETLEDMMLVKFDVNGVDMIGGVDIPFTGPVTFANGDYPTNLPDFLNSLGIPGFTFGYANFRRKRFSIQYPVGVEFEFIIENVNNGQDMYRWTHEHQSQGTFLGLPSWTVYAYFDNPYPENCILIE